MIALPVVLAAFALVAAPSPSAENTTCLGIPCASQAQTKLREMDGEMNKSYGGRYVAPVVPPGYEGLVQEQWKELPMKEVLPDDLHPMTTLHHDICAGNSAMPCPLQHDQLPQGQLNVIEGQGIPALGHPASPSRPQAAILNLSDAINNLAVKVASDPASPNSPALLRMMSMMWDMIDELKKMQPAEVTKP